MLIRTDAYLTALTDVARRDVLYRAPYQAGGDAYVWRVGGLVPADEDRTLHLLQVCHYIDLIPGLVLDGDHVCAVCLSPSGWAQLAAWGVEW